MEGCRVLQAESKNVFIEGIGLVMNRWTALQMAIENEWGGRSSRLKAQQLAADVLSWFTQTKGPLYIDDLETILDEGMLSLNTEIEDNSIQDVCIYVAETLMVVHEECLQGNYRSVQILRGTNSNQALRHCVEQIVNDHDDGEDDDSDDNIVGDASQNSNRTSNQ
ncbi:hypothetical protein VNO77_25848 [Canavalia gladiata]|uniref:Pre-rRNA-processing protein TSR2 homolog n=1 Tax=Canavalia gladiata TaxID=3824 RepID=A0AAN9KRH7_CANGL